jgi:DNA sulfur modification protein DndD
MQALDLLEKVRADLLEETRQRIQAKTEEYFLQLIWKKATYKSVKIDPNYRLSVENIRGLPALGSLSAGERQVLALAFMAALGTISGFDAPVVIDTPTGRISGKPRENIAETLPDYLRETQATFLMTDTEYTDNVRVRLMPYVGKEYDLRFDEDEGITRIVPRCR